MKVIEAGSKITREELKELAEQMFGDLVKAVVDIGERIMVIDAELHADQESFLLQHGSKQEHLWGINLYPAAGRDDFIEFDSMINVRPSQGNRSMTVDDPNIREKITDVVWELVEP